MLHDTRPTGTVSGRENINLIFHSKIILPKVSFPSVLFFFIHNLKGTVTISPHSTHLGKPLKMSVLASPLNDL